MTFDEWWDSLPTTLPHGAQQQMKMAWDAARALPPEGGIMQQQSEEETPEEIMVCMCPYTFNPPMPWPMVVRCERCPNKGTLDGR